MRSAGRGVEILGIRAQRDRLLERRLEREISGSHREASLAGALRHRRDVARHAPAARSIARLTEFFDSFARLADEPDVLGRAARSGPAGTVARGGVSRDRRSADSSCARDADRQIVVDRRPDQRARRSHRDAQPRRSGSTNDNGTRLHLQDEQARARATARRARPTSTSLERADGGVDIDIAEGRALVVGQSAIALTTAGPRRPDTRLPSDRRRRHHRRPHRRRDRRAAARRETSTSRATSRASTIRPSRWPTRSTRFTAPGYDLNGNTGQAFFAFTVAPVGDGRRRARADRRSGRRRRRQQDRGGASGASRRQPRGARARRRA